MELEPITPRQRELVEAIAANEGNVTAAARCIGVTNQRAHRMVKAMRNRAVRTNPDLPGYLMGKTTVQRGPDGGIERRWDRMHPEYQALETALRELAAEIPPLPRIPSPRSAVPSELLTVYPVTDLHLGMLAWGRETGEDWNTSTAERTALPAFAELFDRSPDTREAVLVFLGDFLHFDSMIPETPASRNPLDTDSRYQKLVETAMRLAIRFVEMTLAKHRRVRVLVLEGNHDPVGSVWLRVALPLIFKTQTRRATFHDSPFPYDAVLHGRTLLGFHHGHKTRANGLAKFFASEPRFRPMWGESSYAHIFMGDIHHQTLVEDGGAIVESLPTLAPKDAWHARAGYVSRRALKSITFALDGEHSRTEVTI